MTLIDVVCGEINNRFGNNEQKYVQNS
jgi:hypothetical protein